MPEEKIMKWFEYAHLPPHLQEVSKKFHEMAWSIVEMIPAGSAERTVALRKLLESKDAAVRARIDGIA
jgi:hypothetical protein